MKIAIIGAGFVGLAAANLLQKNGNKVILIEKDNSPGGLAAGFKEKNWQWSLEKYYHHLFLSDKHILSLAKSLNQEIVIRRPKTSIYFNNSLYQLDSLTSALKFSELTLMQRLHMLFGLGLLRYSPIWTPFEKVSTADILPKIIGNKAYNYVFGPQLVNKFGLYARNISLAWFWARIKARTTQLGYPSNGFLEFAKTIVKRIEDMGADVIFNTEVTSIYDNNNNVRIKTQSKNIGDFLVDRVIVTTPSFTFLKISPQLPFYYKQKLKKLKGLGSINLVLRLNKPFLKDGTYWLSICDKKSPITAIVEHTNFIDKKYYNNEHIVYLGNYHPYNHPHMQMAKDKLIKLYDPYLKKINKNYQSSIIGFKVFTSPFTQPIILLNYSQIMPSFKTPLKNVYLANIQQVYPWDRGTNYAVELGEKIANLVLSI